MAINPNTDFSDFTSLSAAQLNRFPRGIVSYVQHTSPISFAGETLILTSPSFTAVANRYYRMSWYEPQTTNTGGLYSVMRFRLTNISGTVIGESYPDQAAYPDPSISFLQITRTFTAGSTVVVCTAVSTNSGAFDASSTKIGSLVIEDMGPS
jgi:hypothetical protein